jgi:hypothetical protein
MQLLHILILLFEVIIVEAQIPKCNTHIWKMTFQMQKSITANGHFVSIASLVKK